jgi:hypothetical protein
MQMELSKQGKHLKQAYYVQGMHARKGDISFNQWWWARAMKSSLYFRALTLFVTKIKVSL